MSGELDLGHSSALPQWMGKQRIIAGGPMLKVLFVCTGNICRSPTAEGVLRALIERAGLGDRITVDSCGTHDYHLGDPPDPRSCAHAKKRGYNITGLRARMLDRDDFERFDLPVALDRGHERILRRQAPPAAKDKVKLFMGYAPEFGLTDVCSLARLVLAAGWSAETTSTAAVTKTPV
jgi:protein-tyrosine phosphatase